MSGLALAWVVLAYFLTQQVYAQVAPIDRESARILATKFKSYQIIHGGTHDGISAGRRRSADHTLHFVLDSGHSEVNIALTPNDIRDDTYRAVATTAQGDIICPRTAVMWFKGYTNGDTGAPARFTMGEEGPSGFFFHEGRQRFVEPLQRHCPGPPGLLIVYDAADVVGPTVQCDANVLEHYRATQARQTAVNATTAPPPLPSGMVIRIATEADYTYYGYHGQNTNDQILGIINEVEGLYEKDFGIKFRVTYQHVYETGKEDPYTSTDPLTLLQQFRDYWNAHHTTVDRNVAFLFNAVDLPTGTLGRAYQAQACVENNSSYGYFSYRDFQYEAAIVAHEIGHTLSAEHETPEACQADPSLMCAAISRTTPVKFSIKAQTAIFSYLQNNACFTDPLQIRIHPIPTRTELTIESSYPGFSMSLYNILGQHIADWTFTTYTVTIPTNDIAPGLYTLRITYRTQTQIHHIQILSP